MAVRLVSLVRLFLIGYIVLSVAVTFGLYKSYETASQGRKSHNALCAYVSDLSARIDVTKEFIKEHPDGFAGIPTSTLRNNVIQQTKTLGVIRSKLGHCS